MPPIQHDRPGSRSGNGQPRALAAAATESRLTGTKPAAAAKSRVTGTEPAADAAVALAQPAADVAVAPTADATTALVTKLTITAAAVATAAVAADPNDLLSDHLLQRVVAGRRSLEPRLL